MNKTTVNLTFKLVDEQTQKVYGVLEKSAVLAIDGVIEENVRNLSDFVKSLIDEVYEFCEQKGLEISYPNQVEAKLAASLLLSLAHEGSNEISINVLVFRIPESDGNYSNDPFFKSMRCNHVEKRGNKRLS